MNITHRKPFTPGEILLKEFMQPYGLSQSKLARLIGITRRRINEIIKGKRAISIDTALRLGKLFNMTPDYWLNLQIKTDIWKAIHSKHEKNLLEKIKPLHLQTQAA